MIPFKLTVRYHDTTREHIEKDVQWSTLPRKKERIMIGECFLKVGWILHDLDNNEIRVHCTLSRSDSKESFELLLTQHGFGVRGT